jgi:adenosylmethionine-8-amino-7-oxononanoate aminotransferase
MTSFDVRAADRAHVWHPYTQHEGAAVPPAIVRAEGAYLYDDSGHAVFDAVSSWWVTLHGHAHPAIARAIAEQAERLEQVIFAGFTHEPAARLAAKLASIAPRGLSRVFYSDDGSTAVEVAVKMALQYWRNAGTPRTRVVALERAYHGDTFGAMSVSARGVFNATFEPELFAVERLPDPSTGDVADAFETLLNARGGDIAAIIVEPMLLGAGGMRIWSADALRAMRELASTYDVLFIADEVLTGFGRTGPLFACDHAGISPDLMCLSKGLTGGFLPMGATLATDAVFDRFRSSDRAHALLHGHSYTANPLACAAALASIKLLDTRCALRRAEIGASQRAAARRFEAHPRVQNARILGTMLAFEIESDGGYLDPVGAALHSFALDRGVLLRPLGNTVYLLPPYCTTSDDLAKAYAVIDEFLERR